MKYFPFSHHTHSYTFLKTTLFQATFNNNYQQIRNTYVLKRRYEPRLNIKGNPPKKLGHKFYIYDRLPFTKPNPTELILKENVEDYGIKGQIISVDPLTAYNMFILPKLAIYATPENIQKYSVEVTEKEFSSSYAMKMFKYLTSTSICLCMSPDNEWTIQPWHLRAAFRRMNIHVPVENIELPKEPISGPNPDYEHKFFFVTVTMNNNERVQVKCVIHHYAPNEDNKLPELDFLKEQTRKATEMINDLNKNKLEEEVNSKSDKK